MSGPKGEQQGRRQTKAERKEEARLERERIQRQMAAKKRNRTIGVSLVAIAVVAAIAAIIVFKPFSRGGAEAQAKMDTLVQAAPAAAEAAGCQPVQDIGPYGDVEDPSSEDYTDAAHFANASEMPPLETYPSTPPTSGPHNERPLRAGVYDEPPAIDESLHALEHGGTIVWLSPTADPAKVDEVKELFARSADNVGQSRVIVAPYDYGPGGGQLPAGIGMALVAWHRLQLCAEPSAAVAFDFTSQYGFYEQPLLPGRTYVGEAPEPGAPM